MKVEIDGLISPRKYCKRVGISPTFIYMCIHSGKLDGAIVEIDENYYVYPEKVDKILNKKPLKGYV